MRFRLPSTQQMWVANDATRTKTKPNCCHFVLSLCLAGFAQHPMADCTKWNDQIRIKFPLQMIFDNLLFASIFSIARQTLRERKKQHFIWRIMSSNVIKYHCRRIVCHVYEAHLHVLYHNAFHCRLLINIIATIYTTTNDSQFPIILLAMLSFSITP